jgi:DNA-binding XRE family transcriptional regulator
MSDTTKVFDELDVTLGAAPDRNLNDEFVNLALNLARIRREQQLSQSELAKLVGSSQPRIAELEGGQANPTLRTLAKLAVSLGMSVSALMSPPATERYVVTYDASFGELGDWSGEGWAVAVCEPRPDMALVA